MKVSQRVVINIEYDFPQINSAEDFREAVEEHGKSLNGLEPSYLEVVYGTEDLIYSSLLDGMNNPIETVGTEPNIDVSAFIAKTLEFFKKIDWSLMSDQKKQLIELSTKYHDRDKNDALDGIINFIDSIQDFVVDDIMMFDKDQVFHKPKSEAASKVLQLMDQDHSYQEALKIVLESDSSLSRSDLEDELNNYI